VKTLADPRDKAAIIRRLSQLRPDSRRRWGRMSAHQAVCHLADSFRAVTGQRPISPASGVMQRTIVKWIALYLPAAWPHGIATRPEVDQELGGTRPIDFAADVAELLALIDLVTKRPAVVKWQVHPIFGQLSERAWLRWAYLHVDHHLRQFGVQPGCAQTPS
jgi:hypothetical protein